MSDKQAPNVLNRTTQAHQDRKNILNQTILYGLLILLITAVYGLLISGFAMIFSAAVLEKYPLIIGIIVFILAIIFLPLRNLLQKNIDFVFSRHQATYKNQIQKYEQELTQDIDLPKIVETLYHYVQQNLAPSQIHIFTYDALSDHYISNPKIDEFPSKPSSDLRFSSSSALVEMLSSKRAPIILDRLSNLPIELQIEQTRIALLASQIFVPLTGRQRLIGWLALGLNKSGNIYNSRDLGFVEALCDHAALAIERAQIVADLERRVLAMNVLTRVSQGINITLAFDDILELIYAQTNNIIPTRDFRICLYNKLSDYLYFVFYLENDERLREVENVPIPIGQGLEREVQKGRRPIITDDFQHECRSRGILPGNQTLFAWVGVPLNTGAETIGVISLASRDSSTVYTEDQVNLLQTIADQAAGAIVKARLLQEAEHRTKLLTTLNEVARSLASTLEIDPLLHQILISAVEILNCEAGSLLLVESETSELTFVAAVSPVANDLLGKHIQPGIGLVGKAVDTQQPIIANDVQNTKEWSEYTDLQTGFNTRDLLVVPMQVKDRVTGAIEVINRKDGMPFAHDDQELLMAFASQAAVALENAQLYTQTDQTLAARIEELSVMQRIDRELNASLDISNTMRITLEWALRQSKAEAGLVGITDNDKVLVKASQGYTNELSTVEGSTIFVETPMIKKSIITGQPLTQIITDKSKEDESPVNILINGKSQIVIPIRREAESIGIVLLESRTAEICSEDTLAFLSRLSDHAAIAISNAQLYSAVQSANLAKSEFVSFVSHELKTPMTSIKGFSDLLAAGVVGPVNEAQGNFLNTIRSNVDRMATLVSDLADVSRIEAGRLKLEFSAVPLYEIVDEIVRSAKAQIEAKEQILTLNIPEKLPALWGDRTRLIQVLTNLINNAHKYTPHGKSISVTAELADNQWDPSGAPQVIHISVQDEGIGISPENQKKIFQKFFRADDQKVRDVPGTGLGLNITKTLVEMQGGQIWFESVVDIGTTFHFTIPIVEST